MGTPAFKNGDCEITDFKNRKVELSEGTWKHIIGDRSRRYFGSQFEKIQQTLRDPCRVLESRLEKNVVLYERYFEDFFVNNTVLGHAVVYVVVNLKTNRVRTAYANPARQKSGKVLWER